MIEKLEELTMARFIDLVAGDTSVLMADGDVPELQKSIAARNILFEYREIVDPAGMRSYLMETEELLKARITIQILTICENIIALDFADEARAILGEIGIQTGKLGADRINAVIKSRLGRARATISDIEKAREAQKVGETDIRRRFDEQTAAMMTYFRFQIDLSSIKATVYAHMVAQYSRELKALSKTRQH